MDPSLSVLVADDSEDDVLLLQQAFKSLGLMRPLHIVSDGGELIEYLKGEGDYTDRSRFPYPDIVMLDLKMPAVSGLHVLEWIQQNPDFRVIPTIICSASSDVRDVKNAYCLGAHGYLCKPVDFNQFRQIIQNMLAYWENCLRPNVDPSIPKCADLNKDHPMMGAQPRKRY